MKDCVHRMTKQRAMILEELKRACSHPTADEVYHMVRRRLSRISMGTIYRNLEVLTEMGEIQTLELAGTQRHYDGNPEPHYHIRCVRCDLVEDAPVGLMPELEENVDPATDFKITGHRLEFLGLCEKCSEALAVNPSEKALLL